jgi:acetylornithine deacetylase
MPPTTPQIDPAYVRRTLARLVQTPSINPFFDPTSRGEVDIAAVVADELTQLGMTIARSEPEPNRISVIGRLEGTGGGKSLMLYAHHDTVGVTGMPEPYSGAERDGRLYGRGSYDMKGGLAACLAAVRALRDAGARLSGDVVIVSVADEEVASIGMTAVLRTVRTDAAIVTEATELQLCLAHKGFSWIEVQTFGRAAHGSRFEEGIDANMRMGRLLARLEHLEIALRQSAPHPLVGPPSLHAGVLQGGSGPSIYAAACRLEIERRSLPHETEQFVVQQIQNIIDQLATEDATFKATVHATLTRPSFEVSESAPIVGAIRSAATEVLGAPPPVIGVPYWMDASLIAERGTDTVVMGPIGAGAHADEEWVDLRSVEQLADILARTAIVYCG